MSRWSHPTFPILLGVWALTWGQRQLEAAATSPSQAATVPPSTRIQLHAAPAPDTTFHVSPSGRDTGTGSAEQPFATIERARDAIRLLHAPSSAGRTFAVIVHGGEYRVSETCVFDERDSGAEGAPIVYKAAAGEKPLFRGGVVLRQWRALQDPVPPRNSSPAAAQSHVWECELQAVGLTNLLPLRLGGFASGNGFKTHPAHELFFNGRPMQLAHGPNEGFLRVKDVAVQDGTEGTMTRKGSKTGKFIYDGDRPARWTREPELLLYGYWFWDWADSYERVSSIDPDQHLVTLAKPWHTYGYSVGAPFYAVNALSELDAEGEWYSTAAARARSSTLLLTRTRPRWRCPFYRKRCWSCIALPTCVSKG